MGFDVVHFNLHKTFSTPHGGGGPGDRGRVLRQRACHGRVSPAGAHAVDPATGSQTNDLVLEASRQPVGHARLCRGVIGVIGLAALFGYLYLISNEVNRLAWARYPAVALVGLAVFVLVVEGGGSWFQKVLLPLGLLAAGVIYIIRALRARDRE